MNFDPQVEASLQALMNLLEDEAPEMAQLLREGKEKGTEPHILLMSLMEFFRQRPDMAQMLEALTLQAFAPLRETSALEPLIPPEPIPVVMHPEGKSPKLNPLYEAALSEQIQFDRDIPELRTGPLPDGVSPAVPVDTDVRNPVALGDMLGRASQDVQEEQRARKDEVAALLADPLGADRIYALVAQEVRLQEDTRMLQVLSSTMVDLDGYRRGEMPALRSVPEPAGASLLALTPEEEAEATWQFLSTTQGRRTALRALRGLMWMSLTKEGLDVSISTEKPQPGKQILAYASWSLSMGEEHATQARFAYVDMAAAVLTKGLMEKLQERVPVTLEIVTVDTVDVRRVGWAARLIPQEG